jgi:hypothetical protein
MIKDFTEEKKKNTKKEKGNLIIIKQFIEE